MGLDIVNSPWAASGGSQGALTGPIPRPCDIFANSGGVNSLSCLYGCCSVPLWVPNGPRTGPIWYKKHWGFPCGVPTTPVRALQWRHNECDAISNHQPHDCLLNCIFRRRSKKTSNLRVTSLCEGNSPVTAQRFSNTKNVWWRHHVRSAFG